MADLKIAIGGRGTTENSGLDSNPYLFIYLFRIQIPVKKRQKAVPVLLFLKFEAQSESIDN